MFGSVLRKCRRCGHRVPIDSTVRMTWEQRTTWVCSPCASELTEKATGYRQGEFELDKEPLDDQDPLPF